MSDVVSVAADATVLQTETATVKSELIGVEDNRAAIGARVAIIRKDGTMRWNRIHTDGSYLSASDPRAHFGLGPDAKDANVAAIGVVWPNGSREMWNSIKPIKVDAVNVLKQKTGKVWNLMPR